MKRIAAAFLLLFPIFAAAQTQKGTPHTMFVMHGGAGIITRQNMTREAEKHIRDAMELALRTGHKVLVKGGTSVDAVEKAIRMLEDAPVLQRRQGRVFTHEGKNELDSAIMDGENHEGGRRRGREDRQESDLRKGNFAMPFNTQGMYRDGSATTECRTCCFIATEE